MSTSSPTTQGCLRPGLRKETLFEARMLRGSLEHWGTNGGLIIRRIRPALLQGLSTEPLGRWRHRQTRLPLSGAICYGAGRNRFSFSAQQISWNRMNCWDDELATWFLVPSCSSLNASNSPGRCRSMRPPNRWSVSLSLPPKTASTVLKGQRANCAASNEMGGLWHVEKACVCIYIYYRYS